MGKLGLVITLVWMSLFGLVIFLKWEQAALMKPNEWGDLLAGATSPIAFLWLIIGYHQQRKELQMNTQALLHQKEELSKQVEELSKQNEYQKVIARAAEEQRLELPSNHEAKAMNQAYNRHFVHR